MGLRAAIKRSNERIAAQEKEQYGYRIKGNHGNWISLKGDMLTFKCSQVRVTSIHLSQISGINVNRARPGLGGQWLIRTAGKNNGYRISFAWTQASDWADMKTRIDTAMSNMVRGIPNE